MQEQDLIDELEEIGAFQFGEFTLKSGQASPLYIDLRLCISFPYFMQKLAKAFVKKLQNVPFDLICGVPYAALSFATALSLESKKPLILRRKEKKIYGMKQKIEGIYQKGQKVLILEDLVTTGSSALETLQDLQQEGLVVEDVMVLLDRCQGGKALLKEGGYHLHALLELDDVLQNLYERGKLKEDLFFRARELLV